MCDKDEIGRESLSGMNDGFRDFGKSEDVLTQEEVDDLLTCIGNAPTVNVQMQERYYLRTIEFERTRLKLVRTAFHEYSDNEISEETMLRILGLLLKEED